MVTNKVKNARQGIEYREKQRKQKQLDKAIKKASKKK